MVKETGLGLSIIQFQRGRNKQYKSHITNLPILANNAIVNLEFQMYTVKSVIVRSFINIFFLIF